MTRSWARPWCVTGTSSSGSSPRDCAATATPWPATCCWSGPASPSTARPGRERRSRWPTSSCVPRSSTPRPCVPPWSPRARITATASMPWPTSPGAGSRATSPGPSPTAWARWWSGGSWPVPPIFGEVRRLGGVTDDEMARVFNLGLGMVMVVAADRVDDALGAVTRRRRGCRGGGSGARGPWRRPGGARPVARLC